MRCCTILRCNNRSCCSFRTLVPAVCRRRELWQRGFVLLTLASVVSFLVPNAPLNRLLLSEDAERRRLLTENEIRLQQSEHFLQQYRTSRKNTSSLLLVDSATAPDVAITVLTMARGRHVAKGTVTYRTKYLTQSVASLLRYANDSSLRRSYSLNICNVDDQPQAFAEVKGLEDLIPAFIRYGRDGGQDQKAPESIWEKLKMDYLYCLQQTLAGGARYALLVEDDAVAHSQLFNVLEHVLENVVEVPNVRPLTYLKLYHPQRLLGYLSLEVERVVELLALSLTLGMLLTLTFKLQDLRQEPTMSSSSLLLTWSGWSLVVVVLALAVGRVNLLELRRLLPQLYQVTPTPSCCIPAVLYSRDGAQALTQHLLNVSCTASHSTDVRMDEFRQVTGARALLVQPSLFSHIGILSSLRTKEVSALNVP